MTNGIYITQSELLEPGHREVLRAGPHVVVSGQPLMHVDTEGESRFFDDCAPVVDLELHVQSATLKSIPPVGHNHLSDLYTGDYPAITGYTSTGEYYQLGARRSLGFVMRSALS
jgi:hypothetical protein